MMKFFSVFLQRYLKLKIEYFRKITTFENREGEKERSIFKTSILNFLVKDQNWVQEVTSGVHAKNYQHRKTRSRRKANTHYFLSFTVRNGGVTDKIVCDGYPAISFVFCIGNS